MKTKVLAFSLFLLPFTPLAQPPNWDSVYTDYFIKYQPVDTPAWLFPICFKDYNDDWDTVYIGHDPKGTWGNQGSFGIKLSEIDTSKFNAYLVCYFGGYDSCLKAGISIIDSASGTLTNIEFTKGRMPLTMYWDDSLFYSDSLPFLDLDPLPRARGELWCGDGNPMFINCPTGFPIVMTGNPDSIQPPTYPFLSSDSIFFDGDTAGPYSNVQYMVGTLLLYIVPYNKSLLAIEEKSDPNLYFNFYPNPVSKKLNIENKDHLPFT